MWHYRQAGAVRSLTHCRDSISSVPNSAPTSGLLRARRGPTAHGRGPGRILPRRAPRLSSGLSPQPPICPGWPPPNYAFDPPVAARLADVPPTATPTRTPTGRTPPPVTYTPTCIATPTRAATATSTDPTPTRTAVLLRDTVDCRGVAPDCCPCPGGDCGLLDLQNSRCRKCKEYFCALDPLSPACLGEGGTCPPNASCGGAPATACATATYTRMPACSPTCTATPTRTTPIRPTRTPTATPPTPRIPGLAVLILDGSGNNGERVTFDVYLVSSGKVGGLQFYLLLLPAAVAPVDVSEQSADCVLQAAFLPTHRLPLSRFPDHPVAGFDRVPVLGGGPQRDRPAARRNEDVERRSGGYVHSGHPHQRARRRPPVARASGASRR